MVCLVAGLFGAAIEYFWTTSAGWDNVLSAIALGGYLISYLAGSWHTSQHAFADLKRGVVNIDVLMLLAAAGSAALGHWADGAALLFLFSLSHALEAIILGRTRRAISELMNLTPEEAVRLSEGKETRVSVAELQAGDRLLVKPGERIPADGELLVGSTSVDESPVNGESIPVDKSPGDHVFAGTLNQQGVIELKVLRAAGQSTLARMVELVEKAQSERATTQQFTEWFGERYSWVVLGLAAATFLGWLTLGNLEITAAFARAMTVLVVAAPCAVVISIPSAILAGISSAARGGVLFKGGIAMERAATLKGMAFDKTGTLTQGRPRVVELLPAEGVTENFLLQTAAALEAHSEHPLARAIVNAAKERQLEVGPAVGVAAVTGAGVVGQVDSGSYLIGKLTWLKTQHSQFAPESVPGLTAAMERGETVVGLVQDGSVPGGVASRVLGALAISDTLRPTAGECLRQLRGMGITELIMLTGDAEPVARELGRRLDLSYRAAMLPADKLQTIQQLKERVGPIGMIGDGMNDAPSLAAADLGFSLGGAGTDVALETADVVILADDLRRVPYAIALARKAQVIIRQNLLISFGVMATLLTSTFLIELPLPLAVLGHEGSTVVVILNGLRLLRFPRPAVSEPLPQQT